MATITPETSKQELMMTSDLRVAEQIATVIMLEQYDSGVVDSEFMAEALVKQKQLGFGDENNKRWAEATEAGIVLKAGDQHTGPRGEMYNSEEWNQGLYYVGSRLIHDFSGSEDQIPSEDPTEIEEVLLKTWTEAGIDIDEVMLIDAKDPRDSIYSFPPAEVLDKQPQVCRVWVHVGHNLGKVIDAELTK